MKMNLAETFLQSFQAVNVGFAAYSQTYHATLASATLREDWYDLHNVAWSTERLWRILTI
jgi:hypothetical protein